MKKAVYIAIGINLEGRKSVLGMWVGENESAKFWASVLNNLKNRKVEDILIAVQIIHVCGLHRFWGRTPFNKSAHDLILLR